MIDKVPRLERLSSGHYQLVLKDGTPFLARAGELQNSSLSSSAHMNKQWANLVAQNLNTVLGSVSWEQVEPVEGHFDWAELDEVIKDARTYGLKLVLLWFGTWKNGERPSKSA